MFIVNKFYNSKKIPKGSVNEAQKFSLDAPKLTATAAPKGRGRVSLVAKSQPRPGGNDKENVDPDLPLARCFG